MQDGLSTKVVASATALRLALNREDPRRLHEQIEKHLRGLMDGGILKAGVFLPPEAELASMWGVARGTVRRAIGELVTQGLVDRGPGKGTWVTTVKIHQLLGKLTSFSQDMRARGFEPASELISLDSVPPPLSVQELLGDSTGQVWRLVRRRMANRVPVALETCLIRRSVVDRHHLEEAALTSLYELYRSLHVPLARAVQSVEAVNLHGEAADHLHVRSGTAAFRQERITYDQSGAVVEVVESYYRGDLYRLQVELRNFI